MLRTVTDDCAVVCMYMCECVPRYSYVRCMPHIHSKQCTVLPHRWFYFISFGDVEYKLCEHTTNDVQTSIFMHICILASTLNQYNYYNLLIVHLFDISRAGYTDLLLSGLSVYWSPDTSFSKSCIISLSVSNASNSSRSHAVAPVPPNSGSS